MSELDPSPPPTDIELSHEIDVEPTRGFRSIVLVLILVLMGLYTLYFARDIVVPILLALLFRLFLRLPMNFLTRFKVPQPLAAVIVIVVLFGGLWLLGSALSGPASAWIADAPHHFAQIQTRLEFIQKPLQRFNQILNKIQSIAAPPRTGTSVVTLAGSNLSGMLASNTQSLLREAGTVLLLLFFLLTVGDTFRRRLVEIVPRLSNKKRAVEILNEIEDGISGYLLSITIINAGLGTLTGVAFYFCGMDAPILWGALAFFLNFIPIVGPLCGVVTFLVAGILTFDNDWFAILPVCIYLGLILIEGEVVTPSIMARRFRLNPVAIIVSLILWFWMWGIAGALLAVPLLAAFKIVCDHIEPLAPIGHLLES